MRRALWLVGLLLLAAACTREPGISPGDGNSDPAGASRNPVMSMERLQELALELPDDFSDGLSTLSARKMIREVVPVTDFIDGSLLEPFAASVAASGTKAAATRAGGVAPANASPGSLSAEADVAATLGRIYVVNYEDDAGFAILSADRQLPSVLGYADSGNVTDTMTNPGIKLFLERLPDFVATSLRWDSLTDPDPPVDPDPGGGGTDPGPAPDPSDTTVVYRYHHNQFVCTTTEGPYVKVEWGQGYPFNNRVTTLCPNKMTGRAPAGCTITAMLQIMSSHCYPTSYIEILDLTRVELDWATYISYKRGLDFGRDPAAENRIARFTHMLGINASIDYGCNGSGAAVKNIKKTFEGYGYHTDGVMSYTWDRVREDIDHGLPVFTAATPLSGDRHAWVIDGYKYGYYLTDVFMDVYDANGNLIRGYYLGVEHEYHTLAHCNWGWDGDGNGYFLNDCYSPSGPIIRDEETGSAPASSRPYIKDFEIIKNVHP